MAVLQAMVAAVLVAGLLRAAFGAPPSRRDPVAAGCWLASALLLLAGVPLATTTGKAVLSAAAAICAATAGWWLRGRQDDDGDEPPEQPGPDWGEFDRLRRDWDRPRRRGHPARL